MVGDIHGLFKREKTSGNDWLTRAFCKRSGFSSQLESSPTPAFHHFNGNSTLQIDHIMSLGSQAPFIMSVAVDVRNPAIVSTHDAILALVATWPSAKPTKDQGKAELVKKKPNWDKVDHTSYDAQTKVRLKCFINTGGLDLTTNVMSSHINSILTASGINSGAKKKKKCKRKPHQHPWSVRLIPLVNKKKRLLLEVERRQQRPRLPLQS